MAVCRKIDVADTTDDALMRRPPSDHASASRFTAVPTLIPVTIASSNASLLYPVLSWRSCAVAGQSWMGKNELTDGTSVHEPGATAVKLKVAAQNRNTGNRRLARMVGSAQSIFSFSSRASFCLWEAAIVPLFMGGVDMFATQLYMTRHVRSGATFFADRNSVNSYINELQQFGT